MKQEKQDRIEQILNAWDGAKRAEAPAFFYTRLKAKMERSEQPVKSWLLKPAFVIAALAAVIIINAFIFFQDGNNTITPSSYGEETIQSIAAEYNLSENYSLEEINQ